jgi:hypothetical protein
LIEPKKLLELNNIQLFNIRIERPGLTRASPHRCYLIELDPGTGDHNRIIRKPYVDWRAEDGGRPFSSWSVGLSI